MMSAAAATSADADGSVLLAPSASKTEKIAVALHDGDGDRILDPPGNASSSPHCLVRFAILALPPV
jgi:hypothetical protein